MKRILFISAALAASSPALAHFGLLLPDQAVVADSGKATVNFTAAFLHPMEQTGMTLAKPEVKVYVEGKATDLSSTLKKTQVLGKDAWSFSYRMKKPGVAQFVMTPKPYWEPAEDKFIIHYTKVYVPAFGEEEGFEEPLGLKTEIVPLTRPFGNYAGNIFSGKVLVDGKPVAGAPVEVEYWNVKKTYEAPTDYHVTQVVLTDGAGVFHFVAPFAGWWGFAALTDGPSKLKHQGKDKDVELGAVLWTEFAEPKKTR